MKDRCSLGSIVGIICLFILVIIDELEDLENVRCCSISDSLLLDHVVVLVGFTTICQAPKNKQSFVLGLEVGVFHFDGFVPTGRQSRSASALQFVEARPGWAFHGLETQTLARPFNFTVPLQVVLTRHDCSSGGVWVGGFFFVVKCLRKQGRLDAFILVDKSTESSSFSFFNSGGVEWARLDHAIFNQSNIGLFSTQLASSTSAYNSCFLGDLQTASKVTWTRQCSNPLVK